MYAVNKTMCAPAFTRAIYSIHRQPICPITNAIIMATDVVTAVPALLRLAAAKHVTAELVLQMRLPAEPVTAGQQSHFLQNRV